MFNRWGRKAGGKETAALTAIKQEETKKREYRGMAACPYGLGGTSASESLTHNRDTTVEKPTAY